MGRRDPEGRKRRIVEAAAELVVEVGTERITHRMVAERAEVSLGSTTRYFATLDDLRQAALDLLAERSDADLAAIREHLEAEGYDAEVLARLLHEHLRDRDAVQINGAFYAAAITDPAMRGLSARWSEGVVSLLADRVGEDAARAVALVVDGAALQAIVDGGPYPEEYLRRVVEAALSLGGDR